MRKNSFSVVALVQPVWQMLILLLLAGFVYPSDACRAASPPSGFGRTAVPAVIREPLPAGMFKEEELAALLRVIDQADANPRDFIAAVNALQPLGKEKALAAIGEYRRVTTGAHAPYNLLRGLFEAPKVASDVPGLRGITPRRPTDLGAFPMFPVVIVQDVPIKLFTQQLNINGGGPAGGVSTPDSDIDAFRSSNLVIRSKPLSPPERPLELYDEGVRLNDAAVAQVEAAQRGRMGGGPGNGNPRGMIAQQFLLLVDTVYRPAGEKVVGVADAEAELAKLRADTNKPGIRWDGKLNCYVFAKDGTTLAPRGK